MSEVAKVGVDGHFHYVDGKSRRAPSVVDTNVAVVVVAVYKSHYIIHPNYVK